MKLKLLLAIAFLSLLLGSADAAVTANSAVTAQTPTEGRVQFLQGTDSAGTYKTLYTAGANGSRCNALWSTNNDASATHLLTCELVNGAVKYGGMAITSVVSAGYTTGNPAQNLLLPTVWTGLPSDSDGNPYIQMASGTTLQCTFATAITSSDKINIEASCADF